MRSEMKQMQEQSHNFNKEHQTAIDELKISIERTDNIKHELESRNSVNRQVAKKLTIILQRMFRSLNCSEIFNKHPQGRSVVTK